MKERPLVKMKERVTVRAGQTDATDVGFFSNTIHDGELSAKERCST